VDDTKLWHVGGFFFPPWTLSFPVFAAGLIWLLAWTCVRHRWARIPIALLPVALGCWLGIAALRVPHGYASGYAFLAAYVLTAITTLGAVLMLPWRRSRRAGILGLVAAAGILSVFYAVFLVGYRLELHGWKHKERIAIPATPPQ
jgi:peptidoglycan/LPS O-acetylase OafA/YrhL